MIKITIGGQAYKLHDMEVTGPSGPLLTILQATLAEMQLNHPGYLIDKDRYYATQLANALPIESIDFSKHIDPDVGSESAEADEIVY